MKRMFVFIVCICMLSLTGCDNTTLILSSTSLSLSHDEKQTLTVAGANGNVVWMSTNEFIAGVENGIVIGNHVGECAIKAKSNGATATCKIKVTPKYFTYKEPILDWGITFEKLQARKGEYDSHTTSEGKDLYYYLQDKDKGVIEVYTFGDGVLENSSIMLNIKNSDVTKFLLERYKIISYDKSTGLALFINSMELETATLGVGLRPVTNGSNAYFLITYLPYSDTKSTSKARTRISDDYSVWEIAEQLLK